MTGKSGDSNSTTSLKGNAYIKTETMEIKAESIILSGDDYRYITASGSVNGVNTESHMEFTCESLKYDRTTKIASLEGNVSLTDKDNDVKAQAQMIEYDQEADIAVLQIKINLTQKDNICSGAYAVYHKKDQILELSGNAQIRQKEDLFRAQYITLDMDTQDITLGGNVKGTVKDSKETKSESKDKKSEKVEKADKSDKSEAIENQDDAELTEETVDEEKIDGEDEQEKPLDESVAETKE